MPRSTEPKQKPKAKKNLPGLAKKPVGRPRSTKGGVFIPDLSESPFKQEGITIQDRIKLTDKFKTAMKAFSNSITKNTELKWEDDKTIKEYLKLLDEVGVKKAVTEEGTIEDPIWNVVSKPEDINSYVTYPNIQEGQLFVRLLTKKSVDGLINANNNAQKDPQTRNNITRILQDYMQISDSPDTSYSKVLKGHTGCVYGVAYSPDGNHIASASGDNTLRIWDAATRACRATLQGHTDCVSGVAYSPDGNHIASASWDTTLRIWDAATGACRATLQGHTGCVRGVAYSPEGNHIASASDDNTLRIWNAATIECIKILTKGHTKGVTSVAYSPDGNTIASGSKDYTLCIWNIKDILSVTQTSQSAGKRTRAKKTKPQAAAKTKRL